MAFVCFYKLLSTEVICFSLITEVITSSYFLTILVGKKKLKIYHYFLTYVLFILLFALTPDFFNNSSRRDWSSVLTINHNRGKEKRKPVTRPTRDKSREDSH